jgi:hypothetical protein
MMRIVSLVMLCLAPAVAHAQLLPPAGTPLPPADATAPADTAYPPKPTDPKDQAEPTDPADPLEQAPRKDASLQQSGPQSGSAPLFPAPPASETLGEPVQGLLFAPTARMLEAGAISASGAIDTVGGAQLELKIGLGGVAEFGIGSTDHIRVRDCASCDARTVRFVPVARFVMGLPEHRMFRHQPALALGFQKSFTRNHDGRASRYASLYMVASKRIGTANLHGGVMVWDGVIQRDDDSEVALHDEALKKVVRPYGGFEILARERSHVIVDLTWNPELEIARSLDNPDRIRLRPMLSWGVRYAVSPRTALEAGVRVPDISDANLLDAQIFAQLRLSSRAISAAIEGLQGE